MESNGEPRKQRTVLLFSRRQSSRPLVVVVIAVGGCCCQTTPCAGRRTAALPQRLSVWHVLLLSAPLPVSITFLLFGMVDDCQVSFCRKVAFLVPLLNEVLHLVREVVPSLTHPDQDSSCFILMLCDSIKVFDLHSNHLVELRLHYCLCEVFPQRHVGCRHGGLANRCQELKMTQSDLHV